MLGEHERAVERLMMALRLSPIDPALFTYAKRDFLCLFVGGTLRGSVFLGKGGTTRSARFRRQFAGPCSEQGAGRSA
jgi:hypothetical protein